MLLSFRQGIISGTNFITNTTQGYGIQASQSQPVQLSIAFGNQNLYYRVSQPTNSAFNLPSSPGQKSWLYFDIDVISGEASYGHTTIEPVTSSTAPNSPSDGLHWFDTTNMIMKVYQSGRNRFISKARIFLAAVTSGGIIQYYGTKTSQVGVNAGSQIYHTGRILFDDTGRALKSSNGNFITTETDLYVGGGLNLGSKIENSIVLAQAQENIPAFKVVLFSDYGSNGGSYGQIKLADYDNLRDSIVGITTEAANTGDVVQVAFQGNITNLNWDWESAGVPIGAQIYVGADNNKGNVVGYDPHDVDPFRPKQVPIGRVLGKSSIYFEQGMGGIGEKGPKGPPGIAYPATTSEIGGVTLSNTPSNPNVPIAVSNNDPRLYNSRPPTSHTHSADDINPPQWQTIDGASSPSTYMLESGDYILVNTSQGQVTAILPSSPSANDTIVLVPSQKTYSMNSLLIDNNNNLINGVDDTVEVDTDGLALQLIYAGGSTGWVVTDYGDVVIIN